MKCLDDFGAASGQNVNVQKTMIMFSRNVSDVKKDELVKICGFKQMEELGRYLGSHNTYGRRTREQVPVFDGQNPK